MSVWSKVGLASVFGLVALGMAPLNMVYFQNLWAQKHYQFFPVLVAAVVALLVARWNMVPPPGPEADDGDDDSVLRALKSNWWPRLRPLAAIGLMAMGLAIEYAAIRVFSPVTPWGGYLGLLVAGFGAVLYVGGGRPISLIPAWALMALILMPPGNADDHLITYLQQRTASFTSQLLDLIGVDHVREGVLIEIGSRTLFVEEACSGVQSLFSLLAVAAVLSVWHSRSLFQTLCLFGAAVLGAGAINVLRTVAIVYGLDQLNIDLLKEPQHTVLGVAVFLVAMAWLLLCDAFLTFLLRPIDVRDDQYLANVWVTLWNRLAAGFRWGTSPEEKVGRGPAIRWLCRTGLAGVALFGGWMALESSRAVQASLAPGANPLTAPVKDGKIFETLASMSEESLPRDLEGWRRVSFQAIERKENVALGEHSKEWVYATPYGMARLSVDYPFRGWHNLAVCYVGSGWYPGEEYAFRSDAQSSVNDFTQFTMRKLTGEQAVVVFAAMNDRLEAVPSQAMGGVTESFVKRVREAITATDNMETIAQTQILLQHDRPLTEEHLADLYEHLRLLRNHVASHLRQEVTP
jgi:exosortase